ncbi:hypothetical protein FDP41_009240 [Naegleria fowleri]|uniref:Uncharacterized protein n=1 Tax=Naegleria fowleri TaxID=5763 RepID=A0A6A5B202_NAEFO|nr:uncharacterized protein FDP41_009240 [Naegleria fowleri]KAF0972337.1 hypothetical protein FDP41_009240 [Naegleria fowleri]
MILDEGTCFIESSSPSVDFSTYSNVDENFMMTFHQNTLSHIFTPEQSSSNDEHESDFWTLNDVEQNQLLTQLYYHDSDDFVDNDVIFTVTDKDSETINESFDIADIDPNDLLSFCLETDDTEDRTEEESPEFTPSEFKLPHPPGRQIRCKKGCTRCTGRVCKKAGLKCSTECECGSECKNLQKDSNHFQNGWDLNGKFSKVEIKAPQRSGPTNIPENFTLLKSANLIWDESIIEHVWCRTNWKKEYCETFETKLSKHKEWQEAKTKHYLAKKTTKRKYVHISENEIPPLIEDENPFTLPEPKFEDFDSFYR